MLMDDRCSRSIQGLPLPASPRRVSSDMPRAEIRMMIIEAGVIIGEAATITADHIADRAVDTIITDENYSRVRDYKIGVLVI